jgi:cleavage stimulation factor subunit 1
LLTGGQDTTARIWDVATGKEVVSIDRNVNGNFRIQAIYSHDNQFVFTADETSSSIFAWDASSGIMVSELKSHSKFIRCLTPSPTERAFISCSDDCRARFWAADD